MEDGCLGNLIGLGIGLYLLYLFIRYIVIPVVSVALSVLAVVGIIALVVGAVYGLIISAYNYIEAINRVFGERVYGERE